MNPYVVGWNDGDVCVLKMEETKKGDRVVNSGSNLKLRGRNQ
ncbi:MAG: hypothetical protein ACHQU1_12820 [Gemmatimonadales bacterium]